jgi:hypothetical protein
VLPTALQSQRAIVPDADNFEHIAALQFELITGPSLICPEGSYYIVRVDIVLRVVILEELELLRLSRRNTFWT